MDRFLLIIIAVSIFLLAQNGDAQAVVPAGTMAPRCGETKQFPVMTPNALRIPPIQGCMCPPGSVPCPALARCTIRCLDPILGPHFCYCCYDRPNGARKDGFNPTKDHCCHDATQGPAPPGTSPTAC